MLAAGAADFPASGARFVGTPLILKTALEIFDIEVMKGLNQ